MISGSDASDEGLLREYSISRHSVLLTCINNAGNKTENLNSWTIFRKGFTVTVDFDIGILNPGLSHVDHRPPGEDGTNPHPGSNDDVVTGVAYVSGFLHFHR